jgi:Ca-activated chloride channel homolog
MLRKSRFGLLFLLSLVALLVLATACSPTEAEKLNNEGNSAYAEQAFQDALVAYQTAQIKDPELAEPYYNAANALYRQGMYDAALEQMDMALSYADEESLAQAGYYNLGNTSYNRADSETAVASYVEALLLNPDDQDAKYNLELALQQQQEQQQQNEEQQQEEDQQGEGDQEQQDQEGQGQEEEQDQQGQGDQQQEEQQGEGDQEQQDQEGQGQEEEQNADSQEGQQSDEGQEGQEQQDQQDQQDQQGEQGEQDQQQGQGQPQDGQPDENQEGQLNQLPQPGQRMTQEQAEQLLAAIARDGQTLQEKLGQIFAVPWTPPVQDW